MNGRTTVAAMMLVVAAGTGAFALELESASPRARSNSAPVNASIVLRFDRPVDRARLRDERHFWAYARWSGTVGGTIAFSDGDETVTLIPDRRLSSGEMVTVFVSRHVRGADGSSFSGFSYAFWTRTTPSPRSFVQVQRLDTRDDPARTTRAYGGVASDLDEDGFLDLAIVNEDTADVRVFANAGDGTVRLSTAFGGPYAVGRRASPSDTADFDRDGHADLAVVNIDDRSVSVLLGDGRGGYVPSDRVRVGREPRGIAVLDADSDGDVDIVNTNAGDGTLSLMLNDGGGRFGVAATFDGGGEGEWALAAGDMNEDGLVDLIVGARGSEEVIVLAGDGRGGFDPVSRQGAGGDVWMLVVGDVDGDFHDDVALVSFDRALGAILRGTGDGRMLPAETYPIDPGGLATDLGDVDGDGDLDWVTSSFFGDWLLFQNHGNGNFSMIRVFPAREASSCAILFDADNDSDLDLALVDELADEVLLFRNGPRRPE